MATLFRPAGLHELALFWDSGFREFPPRLWHQPFFYPVANVEYAKHIAAHWNVDDEPSGFAGFVTRFEVADDYLAILEPHAVGTGTHVEYWIPDGQLPSFNCAIVGVIVVEEAFFGPEFVGYVPQTYGLKGKGAVEQFVALARTWEYSRMDFIYEVSANRKAVWLNSWFWVQHDFEDVGMGSKLKRKMMERLREAWEFNQVNVPLPPAFRKKE